MEHACMVADPDPSRNRKFLSGTDPTYNVIASLSVSDPDPCFKRGIMLHGFKMEHYVIKITLFIV